MIPTLSGWRVAVSVAAIRWFAVRDIPSCIGKDHIVDVGVFHGRVRVLPTSVDQEDKAEYCSDEKHAPL